MLVVDVWQGSSAAAAQFDGAVAHCSVAVVFTAFLYLFKKQACDMQLPTQIQSGRSYLYVYATPSVETVWFV